MTDHERVERLLKSSDERIKRTEEIIGCPIEQYVMAQWQRTPTWKERARRLDRRSQDRRAR